MSTLDPRIADGTARMLARRDAVLAVQQNLANLLSDKLGDLEAARAIAIEDDVRDTFFYGIF